MNKWPITTQKETKHYDSPGKCKPKAQSDSTHTSSVPQVRKSESVDRDVKTWGCREGIAQWLRWLLYLIRVVFLTPGSSTTIHNSCSKESDIFFCLYGHQAYM